MRLEMEKRPPSLRWEEMALHPTISKALESFMYLWIGMVASATSFEYVQGHQFFEKSISDDVHWGSKGMSYPSVFLLMLGGSLTLGR